ncbi:hypothetical protein FQR65_LT13228 [Abscondita terminalis]|nr:hypothetical protein FQR65_LT13228 [Abscondita terminalis]
MDLDGMIPVAELEKSVKARVVLRETQGAPIHNARQENGSLLECTSDSSSPTPSQPLPAQEPANDCMKVSEFTEEWCCSGVKTVFCSRAVTS